jgi:hypothetical protein
MKKNMKKQFEGTEFEQIVDVNTYCDCVVKEYKKFPLTEIMEDRFKESEEAKLIEKKCMSKSLKE